MRPRRRKARDDTNVATAIRGDIPQIVPSKFCRSVTPQLVSTSVPAG